MHARAEAFPLGFAVLTRKGVTAWRQALIELGCHQSTATVSAAVPTAAARSSLPAQIAAELIDALTAVALAGI